MRVYIDNGKNCAGGQAAGVAALIEGMFLRAVLVVSIADVSDGAVGQRINGAGSGASRKTLNGLMGEAEHDEQQRAK
jgi:hypothetical protein